MAISQSFDDLLKNARLLPEESLIAVHFKGGKGGIVFGLDARSHSLTPGHIVLPHSGTFSGYDVAAVVEEARMRASFLADELRSNRRQSGDRRAEQPSHNADQAATMPERCLLPPWPWR
jgi:hypothetical protein